MTSRKTIPVDFLIENANTFMALSDDSQGRERSGVASMLEVALHAANRYKGFSYLDGHEAVIAGNYDDTRRIYA